ncbi:CLUMA_CG014833, isoform A [Clunio marinus]|uniref:CLUMA_CG014833, isoform A n=1 Tax=Clunio marinus TaxID=568069 RepID=A0A1J1ILE2_9DIPT|nr:CLUMA_CG014833, isoform A [Clunio marinus]
MSCVGLVFERLKKGKNEHAIHFVLVTSCKVTLMIAQKGKKIEEKTFFCLVCGNPKKRIPKS